MTEEQYTLSLLTPEGVYTYHDLTDQTINDLSLPFLAEQVGKTKDERQIIFDILKRMPVSSDGTRNYKVRFTKPEGKSFAREIAAQYGITFEQLHEQL